MKITVVQSRLKVADFAFNIKTVYEKLQEATTEIVVFPQYDLGSSGGKDLILDERANNRQSDFYEKIAARVGEKYVFIGDVLIHNGEFIEPDEYGLYDINGKKIYVSDAFEDDVECDLYILAHNRYYAMNTLEDFMASVTAGCDFVFVNGVGMADENIYCGASFAKNSENELVFQAPLCEECVAEIDFSKIIVPEIEVLEKQIVDVTTFALREYCENTGFKKVVLGLSGGIDSALTATLAVQALGKENVFGVLMPSMFSSQGSIDDSLALAKNLGIKTTTHSITPLFNEFMADIAKTHKQDLAEENLQARLRGLILMFYSNRHNYLLLTTGNKSEAAMGYGTLYGDMCGGLNLIADLTKTYVYKVANYINRNEIIIPQETIDKAPSAELRPNQKDQDTLPEYAVLDDIIEKYLEQNLSIDEIAKKCDRDMVKDTVKRIHRAQFKRKQACLGVRLTEKSFLNGVNLPIVHKLYKFY